MWYFRSVSVVMWRLASPNPPALSSKIAENFSCHVTVSSVENGTYLKIDPKWRNFSAVGHFLHCPFVPSPAFAIFGHKWNLRRKNRRLENAMSWAIFGADISIFGAILHFCTNFTSIEFHISKTKISTYAQISCLWSLCATHGFLQASKRWRTGQQLRIL